MNPRATKVWTPIRAESMAGTTPVVMIWSRIGWSARGCAGFRLRHHLTSHRLDQRLIQRGKERPFGHGQDDLRQRNCRWPNDVANVVLVERTDRPPRPPRRFPGSVMKKQHKPEALDGLDATVRRLGGPRCRWPLAENHQGRYNALVQAWRHPFLAGLFGEFTSLYQKSAESATLFVKRTTLVERR